MHCNEPSRATTSKHKRKWTTKSIQMTSKECLPPFQLLLPAKGILSFVFAHTQPYLELPSTPPPRMLLKNSPEPPRGTDLYNRGPISSDAVPVRPATPKLIYSATPSSDHPPTRWALAWSGPAVATTPRSPTPSPDASQSWGQWWSGPETLCSCCSTPYQGLPRHSESMDWCSWECSCMGSRVSSFTPWPWR